MKCQQRNLPEFSLSKTKNPANRFFGRSGPDFKNPNPDFPDWIWNFGPIRIRTQEKKKSDPDPDKKTRIRNTEL